MLIKCTAATKTSPNLTVSINLTRRITATRINFKFLRYLYLEIPGEEKAAHSYMVAEKEVKFWSPDHYCINIILTTVTVDYVHTVRSY